MKVQKIYQNNIRSNNSDRIITKNSLYQTSPMQKDTVQFGNLESIIKPEHVLEIPVLGVKCLKSFTNPTTAISMETFPIGEAHRYIEEFPDLDAAYARLQSFKSAQFKEYLQAIVDVNPIDLDVTTLRPSFVTSSDFAQYSGYVEKVKKNASDNFEVFLHVDSPKFLGVQLQKEEYVLPKAGKEMAEFLRDTFGVQNKTLSFTDRKGIQYLVNAHLDEVNRFDGVELKPNNAEDVEIFMMDSGLKYNNKKQA